MAKSRNKGLSSKQMSKLYRECIKKGFGKKKSFKKVGNAKRISKKLMNSKWKKGKFGKDAYLDYDGDKKVNKYDCRPFDKTRQDDLLTHEDMIKISKMSPEDRREYVKRKLTNRRIQDDSDSKVTWKKPDKDEAKEPTNTSRFKRSMKNIYDRQDSYKDEEGVFTSMEDSNESDNEPRKYYM